MQTGDARGPDDDPAAADARRDRAAARVQGLIQEGERLFAQRTALAGHWQDVAMNFYVERADFTVGHGGGFDFASHLMTGQPMQARQELANAIGGMLRPPGRNWFALRARHGGPKDGVLSQAVKAWLENRQRVMREAMYEPAAMLQRATKQADNDYVTFGNAVISVDVNWRDTALLYRCWHLRDVAWLEDFTGRIDEVHRRETRSAHDVMRLFPASHAPELALLRPEEARQRQIQCRHIVLPADRFGDPSIRQPYVSVYIDVEHDRLMEAAGRPTLGYVIPRWQTISGSQYGFSPTVVASLADARTLQDMTRTILEAGEKAVDPPMVATQEAVRSDLALFPGGVTYVDAAYDERLGAALRPISQDRSGLPVGLEMQQDLRAQIAAAWMLNKLTLPGAGQGMTAYEVGQRIQEYIRQALPLFEPIEAEYNGALCQETFKTLASVNAFGDRFQLPDELLSEEVEFEFDNPFTVAGDQEALVRYREVAGVLAAQKQIDPAADVELDLRAMYRDTLQAVAGSARWIRDEAQAAAARAALDREAEQAAAMNALAAGGAAASSVGQGAKAVREGVGDQALEALLAAAAEEGAADDETA